jgi:hypothetical protein
MNVSRKHWWLKLTQQGKPINCSLIYREFPPRVTPGSGRWVNIDDCLGLCCTPTTTTSTTTTTTLPS